MFTLAHVLLHTAILAAAYHTAARVGAQRSLVIGLAAVLAFYGVLVDLLHAIVGSGQAGFSCHFDVAAELGRLIAFPICTHYGTHTVVPLPPGQCILHLWPTPARFPLCSLQLVPQAAPAPTAAAAGNNTAMCGSGSSDSLWLAPLGLTNPSTTTLFGLLTALVAPFFSTDLRWRAIHVLSNGFAWAYGVWEVRWGCFRT